MIIFVYKYFMLFILLTIILYPLRFTEALNTKYTEELSAVEDNLIIKEYPKPSFIQDDHPESRENNLKKARFRFSQIS